MSISRRGALLGAGAAAVVAGVPMIAVADTEAREVLAIFRQLNPVRQKIIMDVLRAILKVQRANTSHGFTPADDAAGYDRLAGEARS